MYQHSILRPLLFSLPLLFSCQRSSDTPKPDAPIEVTTYIVTPQTIPDDVVFIGVVQSSHQVQIRSRLEGYLQKINYKEGSFVKAGDLLFQIDPRRFEAIVREAEANLQREKAGLWQAKETVDRLKPLFEQQAASKKDLDDAMAQFLAEEASVNVLQAKLDEANLDLSSTSILSPISGITSSSTSQEGTLISPNANGTLTTVSILDPIWVILNISESYFLANAADVAKGELIVPANSDFDVTVTLNDGTKFPYHGKVSFVSPLYNQNTGTLATRAVFRNPENILKPGQFVSATVSGAVRPNAIIVPQESVQQGPSGYFVYVVGDEKKVEIRPVVVGDWYKEYWIIKSGLHKDEQVIVAGTNKVKEGTVVKIKKPQKW